MLCCLMRWCLVVFWGFFVGFLVGLFWDGGFIFVVLVLKMNFVML